MLLLVTPYDLRHVSENTKIDDLRSTDLQLPRQTIEQAEFIIFSDGKETKILKYRSKVKDWMHFAALTFAGSKTAHFDLSADPDMINAGTI